MLQPALVGGRLSPSSRLVLTRVAQGMLLGSLPREATAQQASLNALLERANAFLAGLGEPVLAELSQLLGLLASAPGRRLLVGLGSTWEDATAAEIVTALQAMRSSGVALRVQAYQGLHDIVCVPYFSGEESWAVLGYPGPVAV